MDRSLLRSCKACGTEISKYSPFCRNCGHPQGSNVAIGLLVLLLLVLLGSYVAFMIYCAGHAERLATP
jgi:hypothetical protein